MEKCAGFVLGLALGLAVFACGGGEEPATAPDDADVGRESESSEMVAKPAEPANHPPRIDQLRFEPEEPTSGETVRAVVDASDADGDSLWFRYAWGLEGEPVGDNSREIVLRGASKGDRLELSVTASDGKAESPPANAYVHLGNAPPQLAGVEIQPGGGIVAGMDIVARPDARDADGDALKFRYEWTVNGRSVREDGPVLSTEKLRRGDVARVSVVAHDGEDESEMLSSLDLQILNAPPKIVSVPGAPTDDGVFRYQVEARDPDGDSDLQFHLEGAPEGMSVDPTGGTITWQPAADQPGTFSVSVFVDDLHGGRSRQLFEVVVGGPGGGAPPASGSGQ
jgi:hypothetical protein